MKFSKRIQLAAWLLAVVATAGMGCAPAPEGVDLMVGRSLTCHLLAEATRKSDSLAIYARPRSVELDVLVDRWEQPSKPGRPGAPLDSLEFPQTRPAPQPLANESRPALPRVDRLDRPPSTALKLEFRAGRPHLRPGQSVVFTITVSNRFAADLHEVVVRLQVPDDLTYLRHQSPWLFRSLDRQEVDREHHFMISRIKSGKTLTFRATFALKP